jgi:hypothetical protein
MIMLLDEILRSIDVTPIRPIDTLSSAFYSGKKIALFMRIHSMRKFRSIPLRSSFNGKEQ